MELEAIIAIAGVLISSLGVFFTWRTCKNTDNIKDSIQNAVQKERLFAESIELSKRLTKCQTIVRSPGYDVLRDDELVPELTYICSRLKDIVKSDSKNYSILLGEIKKVENLVSCDSDTESRCAAYSLTMANLESIIRSGSVSQ